jgi:type I restriction enzyme S subunit
MGIVTVFRDGEVTLRSNRREDGFTEATDYSQYKLIEPGDLGIHNMDAFAGAIGVSDSVGMCSPVVTVCKPKEFVNSKFMAHVLREMARAGWIQANAKSVRERTSEFRWPLAKIQDVPLPSKNEQDEIVKYLDHALAKIDKLIQVNSNLQMQVKDKIQTVIDGYTSPDSKISINFLNSNFDESEIWRKGRIKNFARLQTGNSLNEDQKEEYSERVKGSIPYFSSKDINLETSSIAGVADFWIPPQDAEKFKRAIPGSFLMVIEGGSAGRKIAQIYKDSYFVNKLMNVHPFEESDFMFWYFQSKRFKDEFQLNMDGLIGGVSVSKIANMEIFCPSQKAQILISSRISNRVTKYLALLREIQELNVLIRERKLSLISAAVTGKIDVRKAS